MIDKKCDFEGKRCYTLKDANTLVNAARRRHWDNEAKHIPKRAYFCKRCGYYHLTKSLVKHNGNKKRKTVSFRNTNERRRIERMEEDIRRYTREYR